MYVTECLNLLLSQDSPSHIASVFPSMVKRDTIPLPPFPNQKGFPSTTPLGTTSASFWHPGHTSITCFLFNDLFHSSLPQGFLSRVPSTIFEFRHFFVSAHLMLHLGHCLGNFSHIVLFQEGCVFGGEVR